MFLYAKGVEQYQLIRCGGVVVVRKKIVVLVPLPAGVRFNVTVINL